MDIYIHRLSGNWDHFQVSCNFLQDLHYIDLRWYIKLFILLYFSVENQQ